MNWLTRLIPSIGINTSTNKSKVPDGLWISCPSCEATLYKPELEKALYVCQKCDHHLRIGARLRLEQFLDNAVYKEIAADIKSKDPLKFKDTKYYTTRVRDAVSATGENEAILIAQGHVKALEKLDEIKGCVPINLGTGNGTSVLEIVNTFKEISGQDIPFKIVPRRAGDIATVFADAKVANKLLNWHAKRDLATMIADTWRWQSQNPNGFE